MPYAAYLAYAFLFFLPFERLPSFEVHGVTVRISIILLLIGLITVIPALLGRRRLGPLSLLDKAIAAYLAVAVLSDLLAKNHSRSTEVLVFLAAAVTGYTILSRGLRPALNRITMLRVIVGSAVVTSLFGLYQFIADGLGVSTHLTGLAVQYSRAVFGFPRVQSVALEPLYFANFLLLSLFVLSGFLLTQKRRPAWYELAALIAILTAFVLTLSRGGYAGAIGGTVVMGVVLIVRRQKVSLRNTGILFGCLVVSLGLALGGIKVFSGSRGIRTFTSQATVSNGDTVSASVTPRTTNYQEAWRLFKQRPVLGWGIGNYGVVNTVTPYSPSTGYMIVNNQYLETLAETGILGFLALAAVVIACLVTLWRAARDPNNLWLAIGLGATLLGILIQYNFLSTIYMLYVWAVLGLISLVGSTGSSERP